MSSACPNLEAGRGSHCGRRWARRSRPWPCWAGLLALLAGGFGACAQPTNSPASEPAPVDYSSFKLIADRNIFNASRSGGRVRPPDRSRARQVDAFTLVGTMAYEKGLFAFFDGTGAEYRKVLQTDGTIAGYKVLDVSSSGVRLVAGTNQVMALRVGMQMRREDEGAWQLSENTESYAGSGGTAGSDSAKSGASSGGAASAGVDDVVKRLMAQREKETK